MRTTEEYRAMIPEEPPADLVAEMVRQELLDSGHMSFKCIGFEEADARTRDDDFYMDLRESFRKRPALLWCSECEKEMLAEYLPSDSKKNEFGRRRIRYYDADFNEVVERSNADVIFCQSCGKKVVLRSAADLPRTEQKFMVVPTVAAGCLVLTKWCVERRQFVGGERLYKNAYEAYIVDGGCAVKLAHYKRGLYWNMLRLEEWKQNKRFEDRLTCPYFYDGAEGRPSLDGTPLENAKLWEYLDQSYEKNDFYPVAYLRLYAKHKQVENLITAGFAWLVADGIRREVKNVGSYIPTSICPLPRLPWINWKETRPAQMLGLNKAEARALKERGYGLEKLELWKKYRGCNTQQELFYLLDSVDAMDATNILENDLPLARTVNYLKKQNRTSYYLMDYLRMAERAGMDMSQEAVRWPKNLRAAHDRAMNAEAAVQADNNECADAFREMSKRCAGLAWEKDGICIRVAERPSELVQEGNVLHHCVGGYSKSHAQGKIILFIRHSRRPDRSWYTLNIDVRTKAEIQLHGYGNELADGKKLQINKKVLAFVSDWRREVLDKWTLPQKPKKKAKAG
mgnify:FL=1